MRFAVQFKRRRSGGFVTLGCIMLALTLLLGGVTSRSAPVSLHARLTASLQMTEYRFSGGTPPHQGSHGITLAGDGNMWVTLESSAEVARVTPGGSISYFALPSQYASPEGIAAGSDGNLWVAEAGTTNIAVLSTAGVLLHEYSAGSSSDGTPTRIVAGPDGNLWFTYNQGSNYSTSFYPAYVGRITTAGVLTRFPVQCCDVSPFDITAGPDGNLWFTEELGNAIGKITPAGVVTEFSLSGTGTLGAPQDIISGPGGKLWFSESNQAQVAAISTDGHTVDLHALGSGEVAGGMVMDSNNATVWYTDAANNTVGAIDSGTGTVTEYNGPSANAGLYMIAKGASGSLWSTEDQLPGVATFTGTTPPNRTVEFVHGIGSKWQDFDFNGDAWRPLLSPLFATYKVVVFHDYEDRGDAIQGTSSCAPNLPVDENVSPLFVDPANDYSGNPCDSQSALAPNAALLYDRLQNQSAPTTIIANSMGGSITRGYLALASGRPTDTSLASVDSTIFIQGVQQGAAVARNAALISSLPGPGQWLVDSVSNALGLDPTRPAERDLAPQSPWFSSVNPIPVPYLHYYNFLTNYDVHLTWGAGFWHWDGGVTHVGDEVVLPGTDNPQDEPWNGGSGFLPYGSSVDQHEYAMNFTYEASNIEGYLFAFRQIFSSPATHLNLGDHTDTVISGACNGSNGSESISAEVARILSNPANACGA